ncbi:MAG TPA: sugar-binding domain-containing protein [Candidatus Lumbricidophila sp.]|nr:sugar-binding domain-containing protein [Candidatus Lumbricidophila sp.]
MDDVDELLAIRAAELYYEEDKTQDEIGQALRLTRWKVGRLLAQAKQHGFIRIEIVHPKARRLPIERRLRDEFGLEDAIVVSAAGVASAEELQARTAQAAADYLLTLRPVTRTLGVSWGRTLTELANHLRQGWATGVSVVQINGGVSLNRRPGTAASTAVSIAHKGGGNATLLPSPAILERLETKQAIEADRVVAGVLDLARSADTYLFSAGAADHHSVHVESGYLTTADVDLLVAKGAVGDVVGRYIDANGNTVDPALDARTVGLTLDELRSATRTIAVISGSAKHPVAAAVVHSRLCTVLVTDEHTALAILPPEPTDRKSGVA